MPSSGSDGGTGFDDVRSQFAGPLLDGICHIHPSVAMLLRKGYANRNGDMMEKTGKMKILHKFLKIAGFI